MSPVPRPHGPPIPFVDKHGVVCLLVPLNTDQTAFATIYRADFEALCKAGIVGAWRREDRYIKASLLGVGGRSINVARILTAARAGQQVTYRNGRPADLRRSNLRLQRGYSSRDPRAELLATVVGKAAGRASRQQHNERKS